MLKNHTIVFNEEDNGLDLDVKYIMIHLKKPFVNYQDTYECLFLNILHVAFLKIKTLRMLNIFYYKNDQQNQQGK